MFNKQKTYVLKVTQSMKFQHTILISFRGETFLRRSHILTELVYITQLTKENQRVMKKEFLENTRRKIKFITPLLLDK